MQRKGSAAKPGELETTIMAIVALKASSALGREFSADALKHIYPMSQNQKGKKSLDNAIKLLEQREFIEFVDTFDGKENFLCRHELMFC